MFNRKLKINKIEQRKKELEKYYSALYIKTRYNTRPQFMNTYIHPDCLVKANNTIYAIEATGYFYQQETDFSNRLYKKVNKYLKDDYYLKTIYYKIGKKPLLNIIDSIYYNDFKQIIKDIKNNIDVIDEINYSGNIYYSNKDDLNIFLNKIDNTLTKYQFEIILKKKYILPIKIILINDINVKNRLSRTLIPIVSFKEDLKYNFNSLRSLIQNKENKLKNIYINDLKKRNVTYDKFILLIHPLDYSLNINEELLYKELKNDFIKTNYDEISIVLDEEIMSINKDGYKLYKRR